MQANLTYTSLARTSLKCCLASCLTFVFLIAGVSSGLIPTTEHGRNEFVEASLLVVLFFAFSGLTAGVTALVKSDQSGDRRKERMEAKTGIMISVLLSIPVIFALTNEYRAGLSRARHGRDLAAMESLRTIHAAQADFYRLKDRFGTLKELAGMGLIGEPYTTRKPVSGYIYSVTDISSDTYCAHADRVSGELGHRDYNVIESGEIRYIESESNGTVPRNGGIPLKVH